MNDEEHTSGDSHQHDVNHTHADSLSNSELSDMLQDQVHEDPANEHHHHHHHHHHHDDENQDEEVDDDAHAKESHLMGNMSYMPPNFYPSHVLRPQHFPMMAPNMFIPATVQFSPTRPGPIPMGKQIQPYPYSIPHMPNQHLILNTMGPYAMQQPMSYAHAQEHHSPQASSPAEVTKTPKKRGRGGKSATSASASGGSGKQKKKHRQRAVRHNWTQEQDEKLISAINSKQYSENGEKIRWTKISQEVFNSKLTPQSVYQRYMRVLNPKLNTKEWTHTEDERLTELFKEHGDQWALIAKKLHGMKADVWIRQRAVRLGLIPDASVKTPGSSPGPETKKSRKRKSPSTRRKSSHPPSPITLDLQKSMNGDEGLRLVPNLGLPAKKTRKGANPTKDFIPPYHQDQMEHDLQIPIANAPYRKRNITKQSRVAKVFKSLDELFLQKQSAATKYMSVTIPHQQVTKNFEQADEEETRVDCTVALHFGFEASNIIVSSYRTHIVVPKGVDVSDRELIVQFPINIISLYTALQNKSSESDKPTERKLFICASLKKVFGKADDIELIPKMESDTSSEAVENKWDRYTYGETYDAYHLLNGGCLEGKFVCNAQTADASAAVSIPINITFASELFQDDNDVFEFSNINFKLLPEMPDASYLTLEVNKLSRFGEASQYKLLQWDMNCPFCKYTVNDFEEPQEGKDLSDLQTFEVLTYHMKQEHNNQFKFQFWNKSPTTSHYHIVASQLKDAMPIANPNKRISDYPADLDMIEEPEAKRRKFDSQVEGEVAMADMLAQYLNVVLITDMVRGGTFADQWNQHVFESMKTGLMKAHADFPTVVRTFLQNYKDSVSQKPNYDILVEHFTNLQEKGMISADDLNLLKGAFSPTKEQQYQDYEETYMHGVQPPHNLLPHPGHPMHPQFQMAQFHFMNNSPHIQLQHVPHQYADHAMRQFPGAQGIHTLQHEYQASQSADQSQNEYANEMLLYTTGDMNDDEEQDEEDDNRQ